MGACNCVTRDSGNNEPVLNTEKYSELGRIRNKIFD